MSEEEVTGANVAAYLMQEAQGWQFPSQVSLGSCSLVVGWEPELEEDETGQPYPTGRGHTWCAIEGERQEGWYCRRPRTVLLRVAEYADYALARARARRAKRRRRAPVPDEGELRQIVERDPFA